MPGLRKDAKIALLGRVPLFERLGKAQLARIAAVADEIDLPEGKVLMRQGERGREFFVLLEGTVDVRRNGRRIARSGPGEFVGEMALVSGHPRTATVTALTPVRALVIRDVDFRAVLLRTPRVGLRVLETLAERLPADPR